MKQLTCEMCGSTDLVKEDGYFVCQTCGTKYSVEEAKKMMIEGTVEVQGTVKVDESDNLQSLYKLARRAKDSNDCANMEKYYGMILLQNPEDWEAAFYSLLAKSKQCTLGEMENKLYNFANSLEDIFSLITLDKQPTYLTHNNRMFECYKEIEDLHSLFQENIRTRSHNYSNPANTAESIKSGLNALSYLNIITGDALYNYAENFPDMISDPNYKVSEEEYSELKENYTIQRESFYKYALFQYKSAVYGEKYKDIAIARAKRIDPNYVAPKSVNSGCYIATCVYGSYDCPEVWTLRRYRDDTLGSTWYGRAFIHTYYAISPTLVKWFGKTKWFKKIWKGYLDKKVSKLQNKGVEDTPYDDKEW